MDNPHELAPPTDPISRIRALARDFAYGAITNMWPAEIRTFLTGNGWEFTGQEGSDAINAMLANKWNNQFPGFDLLQTFGYGTITSPMQRTALLALTQKAFELLEEPAVPPSVFISYGRKQSSAFGLYLECKLSSVGVRAFIDRSIDPGSDWHNHLLERVRGSNVFICLIAPGTLVSPYVREEIQWALEANNRSIAVWHGGYAFNRAEVADFPDWLEAFVLTKHAIRVQDESAEGYYDAAEKLLNRLGYT
jgi:TIR domain